MSLDCRCRYIYQFSCSLLKFLGVRWKFPIWHATALIRGLKPSSLGNLFGHLSLSMSPTFNNDADWLQLQQKELDLHKSLCCICQAVIKRTILGLLWNLEQLSQVCHRQGRWSFFLTSAPLDAQGGVAPPPSTIYVF